MVEERIRRRLAAILVADMVGYSRLVRADEEGTLAALRVLHERIFEPKIAEHDGRIVKLIGDGTLAEFSSAVDAVRAAAEIQRAVAERNTDRPEEQRIEFRIGVNLGDVVVDGDDIQGDGVNVASRLEGLSEAGGMCVSGAVYDQVRDRIDLTFEDLGEQAVKNIDRPVHVWRWGRVAPDTHEPSAATASPLPFRYEPSLAVLPFTNMSGDPDQEYFSDGITEDIITALSRFRWFFVIARNSSFTYKGRAVDVKQVAQDLGVQYVLEGSVRKGGDRVRITAQLIDASTGRHIWAERYDRDLQDMFAVQDEVTEAITSAVAPAFASAEEHRAKLKSPENLDAWACVMRGMSLWQTYKREEAWEAQRLFKQAMDIDPNFAPAHVGYAVTFAHGVRVGFFGRDGYEKALQAARRAVALEDKDAWSHTALGVVHFSNLEHEAAIAEFEYAIQLNPNFVTAHYYLGRSLSSCGKSEAAIRHIEQAMRLSPRDPNIGHFHAGLARAYLSLKQFETAAASSKQALRHQNLQWTAPATLASALGHLGRLEEAQRAIREIERLRPGTTISFVRDRLPITDKDDMDLLLDGLRKAGVPE